MLDHEYVERIESERDESGGSIAADDHDGIWEGLLNLSERCDQLEYAIAVMTSRSIEEVLGAAKRFAHQRHPALSPQEALDREIERRGNEKKYEAEARALDFLREIQRGTKKQRHLALVSSATKDEDPF